ncbi:MAG: TlpA family protein disulfide reductase [Anaerolineaceae bacterium]
MPEGSPNPIRSLAQYGVLAVAAVFAVAVVGYFLVSSSDGKNAFEGTPVSRLPGAPTAFPNTGVLEPNRPKEGERAPDFALVDARDTTKVHKLSDYRGKAVVVNWFASWCDPCKREIPEFQNAQDQLGDQLVVLGVNYLEDPGPAVAILDKLKATYVAVLDTNGAVADHYRVGRGLPVTFFIDKEGVLQFFKTGELTPSEFEANLARVGITYKAQ